MNMQAGARSAVEELALSVFTRACSTLTTFGTLGIQPFHSHERSDPKDNLDKMEQSLRGLMFPEPPSLQAPSKHHHTHDLILDILASGASPADALLADCVLVERWRFVYDPGFSSDSSSSSGSNSNISSQYIPAFISRRCSILLRSLFSLMLLLPARSMLQKVQGESRPYVSYRLYCLDSDNCSRGKGGSSSSGGSSNGGKLSQPMRMSSGDSFGAGSSSGGNGRSRSSGSCCTLGTCFGGASSTFEFPPVYPIGRPAAAGSSGSGVSCK